MTMRRSTRLTIQTVLILFLAIYLVPILAMLMNSFKSYREIMDSFVALPTSLSFINYEKAWKALDFVNASWNSIYMTLVTVVGLLVTTAPCAYKISRTKTRFSNALYQFFTIPYMIPFFAYMIPVIRLARTFHLSNNVLGVSLINIGTGGSFAMFMLSAAVKSIPRDLDEAAFVDGCTQFQTFYKIILPLMMPAVSSVTIIYALWTWNNFMLPFLLLTKSSKTTLIVKVYELFGTYGTDWEIVVAALILISLPILVLYAIFQNKIIGGITAGAVKG